MKETIKQFAGVIILLAAIAFLDILFLTFANNKSDKRDFEHDIILDELYHRVDSLEQRVNRLESIMDSDLLDSKESDNWLDLASDVNAERVLS